MKKLILLFVLCLPSWVVAQKANGTTPNPKITEPSRERLVVQLLCHGTTAIDVNFLTGYRVMFGRPMEYQDGKWMVQDLVHGEIVMREPELEDLSTIKDLDVIAKELKPTRMFVHVSRLYIERPQIKDPRELLQKLQFLLTNVEIVEDTPRQCPAFTLQDPFWQEAKKEVQDGVLD